MNPQIAKIYGACNPDNPATEKFYYDCSEARGGNVFVNQIKDHIVLANASINESSDAADYKCFLFTGHSGCGKSSELKRLVRELDAYSEDSRFYPVFIDANEYLDRFDVKITDILLAIATETADALQKNNSLNIKGNFFKRFIDRLGEEVFSEWEIDKIGVELPFGFASADIKRLAKDDSARAKVRKALENDTYLLLQEINRLLGEARKQITNLSAHGKSQNYKDVVIILDNLEKIEQFDGAEMGLESAQKLFLQYSTQLTGIESHIIYTVPIDLMRSNDATRVSNLYDKQFILPMVKVFQRDGETPFEAGRDAMTEILKLRLGDIKRHDAFTDEALNLLIKYSGGHIRTFLLFAREACTDADDLPITADNVDYAIDSEYQNISPSFFPPYTWETLAKLDLSSNQEVSVDPRYCVEVLEKLLLFEYINGDAVGVKNSSRKNRNLQTPWYAVNPIYRELDQFKRAKAKLAEAAQDNAEAE
ncbi:MAG: hypothetical protein M3T96_05930 [Acidobacteriota bacterium]|nr:hypothetical protein [Acidobacteriota bacterium]